MKKKKFPYDCEYVKKYLLNKNYQSYTDGTYTHYRKILEFIYPDISHYYIRNLIEDLINEEFFIVRFYRGRRYFRIKNKESKQDIGIITF